MSLIITAILIVIICVVFLFGAEKETDRDSFLSKEYTRTLKGLAALIVVFVHFPKEYSNPLQDAVGSFAYIAVTIFFLFSAFGMQFGVENNQRYLKTFWFNRCANLIVPNWLINFLTAAIILVFADNAIVTGNIFRLNHYVWVLLAYCLVFFVVEFFQFKRVYSRRTATILLAGFIVTASLFSYLCGNDQQSDWAYERFGLLWGLLIFRYFDSIRLWLVKKQIAKIVLVTCICLILGICYLKFKYVWFWGEFVLKVVLGLAIVTWLFLCTSKLKLGNRVTRFLGDISFEIYLSHGFIMRLLEYFCPGVSSGVFIVLTFVFCILFSALAHQINIRLIKLIRR